MAKRTKGVGVIYFDEGNSVAILAFQDPNGEHSWRDLIDLVKGSAPFSYQYEYDINSIHRVIACYSRSHANRYAATLSNQKRAA